MENNQKPIRNDKLLEAIKNMQENNSDENVNRMIDCVMEANFITPKGAPVPPDNIEPTPNPDFGTVPRYAKNSTPNFTETDGLDDDFPF